MGDIDKAMIINVSAKIVNSEIDDCSTEILICCAVTDRLIEETALLTVDDFKALQEAADFKIPKVELITRTHIHYTDPNYTKEQMVRKVEEGMLNRSGKTIGIPLFKPSNLPDLRKTDRETVGGFRKKQMEDTTLAPMLKSVGLNC